MLEALIQFQQGAFEFTGGILQYSHYVFTLKKFSKCQKRSNDGDWYSDVFDLGSGEYKLKLNVETVESGPHMIVRLYRQDEKSRGITFVLMLQN